MEIKKAQYGFANAYNIIRNGYLLACHHVLTDEMLDYLQNVISNFINENT